MKKLLVLVPVLSSLLLTGCVITAGTAVAALGIAGAGLAAYCVTGGSGCSTALVSYAGFITTQATEDVVVLESGSTTVGEIQQIVSNLNTAIQTGQGLQGLTAAQALEVKAITSAATTIITLLEPLLNTSTPAEVKVGNLSGVITKANVVVKLPKLTLKDKIEIAKMKSKIKKVKK